MIASSYSPDTKVGDIVAAQPLLASVFARLGIDYCCGGKKTLAEACAARRLDAATVAVMLEAASHLNAAAAPAVDAASMTLTALADHIESVHHARLKEELPIVVEQANRVAMKHGWRDGRLAAVAQTVQALAEEMFSHMAKEENVLFPMVRLLDRDGGRTEGGSLAGPIQAMEAEHDSAGHAMSRLRELTDAFTPDAEACNTHRALLATLAQMETDLHQHVHKENNVLFPRALAREAAAASA